MEISNEFSMQKLNQFFSHLNVDDYKVFWIRSADYNQQIYLSPSFETVWKIPCRQLYDYPASWNDYLIGENVSEFVYLLKSRINTEEKVKNNNTVLYRIKNGNDQSVWVKDDHFRLFDANKRLVAVAGIAQAISEIQWMVELKRCCEPVSGQIHYEESLLNILKKEFNLDACCSDHAVLLNNDINSPRYVVTHSGARVLLSKREVECLHFLIKGKAAKEIARELAISPRTVELHISHIKDKMKCRTSLELITRIRGFSV